MIKPIKILSDLIANLQHIINVSSVTVVNGDYKLFVDNTYYLTINKTVTINGVDYLIKDFELNEWLLLSGNVQPPIQPFTIKSPKFVHGTPKW